MTETIKINKGFITILATILVLMTGMIIVASAFSLILSSIKELRNNIYSLKAYYVAEAGIEDSLLRLSKGMTLLESNVLTIDNITATTEISDSIGGSRSITSIGDNLNRIRKIRVVYTTVTDNVSFHYGAQAGDGGIEMGNNARIKGNVFSNGSIIGAIKGYIDNNVIVAHNGNKIKGLVVGGDVLAHTCENSTITGILTYVSGGSVINCTAGGSIKSQPNEILPEDLPISSAKINDWKNDALDGGIFYNDFILTNGAADSLGPIQIGTSIAPRNLTITNGAYLKVTGTIYVTGNIIVSNNAIVELDNNIYGSLSGMIIADGRITIVNNGTLRGSGMAGSYILFLSTNNSLNPASPAISLSNNAQGAIFYSNSGLILVFNNMKAREITGYKMILSNNAVIEYESGLQNVNFSSGPGGSWELSEWKEIE